MLLNGSPIVFPVVLFQTGCVYGRLLYIVREGAKYVAYFSAYTQISTAFFWLKMTLNFRNQLNSLAIITKMIMHPAPYQIK